MIGICYVGKELWRSSKDAGLHFFVEDLLADLIEVAGDSEVRGSCALEKKGCEGIGVFGGGNRDLMVFDAARQLLEDDKL